MSSCNGVIYLVAVPRTQQPHRFIDMQSETSRFLYFPTDLELRELFQTGRARTSYVAFQRSLCTRNLPYGQSMLQSSRTHWPEKFRDYS